MEAEGILRAVISDGRKLPRKPTAARIKCRIALQDDEKYVKAIASNVSDGGIAFYAYKEFARDQELFLNFMDTEKDHRIRAQVVWQKPLPNGLFQIGLKFVAPDPEDLHFIKTLK